MQRVFAKSLEEFNLKPPSFMFEDAFIPVSIPQKHRQKNDCVVLAISALENLNYQWALLELSGAFSENGVLIDDIQIVLSRRGYVRIDFRFEISLSDLWRAGFFDASRKVLVCLEKEGGGHSIAFNRVFWGDYLPSDDWQVVSVFSKAESTPHRHCVG